MKLEWAENGDIPGELGKGKEEKLEDEAAVAAAEEKGDGEEEPF